MASAVIMPKVGITVETCIITEWKKKVGDPVRIDDILFSYETDKAVMDCPSTAEGELLEIFHPEGDEVPCFENVCAIGVKGEDCTMLRPENAPTINRSELVFGLGQSAVDAMAAASAVQSTDAPVPASAPTKNPSPVFETASEGKDVFASPRAKQLAEKAGVDWKKAVPSGPEGRIIERDVRKLMQDAAEAPKPVNTADAPIPDAKADTVVCDYTDEKLTNIRQTIARAMKKSLDNTAQLTHNFLFDASEIMAYRARLKAAGGDAAGITIGDMILFAVSRTLPSFPDMNAHLLDDKTIRRFHTVHLAVAVDTPRGLLVPVICNAEKKSLLEISKETKVLAQEAISGTINPDKLNGGSFTVSNLGSFGVTSFTPILNPPQVGIIGACRIVDAPRRGKDGQIELYPAMTLSLTYDHRAVDGAPASRFMQEVCRKLENFTVTLSE